MKKKSIGRVEGFANKVRQMPAISKFRNAAREWIVFYQFMHQATLGNPLPNLFREKCEHTTIECNDDSIEISSSQSK